MDGDRVIGLMVTVSEKAANIARICRQNDHLLSFLVREKSDSEKNPRFVRDFKTFTDVLVQEVVKHDLTEKFPSLNGCIYGEESNEFSVGEETVIVEVKQSLQETEALLFKVLEDNKAASLLANEIHKTSKAENYFTDVDVTLPEDVGIWIDPIDSTAEYISGGIKQINHNLYSGLPCVTVLIGIFDKKSGWPIAGVINQPFHTEKNGLWVGQYIYAISYNDCGISGPTFYSECCEKIVAVSSSESDQMKTVLLKYGYITVETAGAGYKLMSIITGHISAYVLSKPTTFFWDTCAPHAILNALGGGIIDIKTFQPIKYKSGKGTNECCNSGGILAYRNKNVRDDLIQIIKSIH